jgi:hypothetical protein
MSARAEVEASIAATVADYREHDGVVVMNQEHVADWIGQFPKDVRLPILREVDHLLKQGYISKSNTQKFLRALTKSPKLAGDDPKRFWKACHFLDIQQGGGSQTELLRMFDEALALPSQFDVQNRRG